MAANTLPSSLGDHEMKSIRKFESIILFPEQHAFSSKDPTGRASAPANTILKASTKVTAQPLPPLDPSTSDYINFLSFPGSDSRRGSTSSTATDASGCEAYTPYEVEYDHDHKQRLGPSVPMVADRDAGHSIAAWIEQGQGLPGSMHGMIAGREADAGLNRADLEVLYKRFGSSEAYQLPPSSSLQDGNIKSPHLGISPHSSHRLKSLQHRDVETSLASTSTLPRLENSESRTGNTGPHERERTLMPSKAEVRFPSFGRIEANDIKVDFVEPQSKGVEESVEVVLEAGGQKECAIIKPGVVTKPLRARFLRELAEYFIAGSISNTYPTTPTSQSSHKPVKIVGLLSNTADPGSQMYADMTKKNCASLTKDLSRLICLAKASENENASTASSQPSVLAAVADHAGLLYEKRIVPGTFEAVKREIDLISEDESVDGLIVYFPLFGIEKDAVIRSLIPHHLDLEGLHPAHLSASYLRSPARASSVKIQRITSEVATRGKQVTRDRERCETGTRENVYPCTPLAIMRFLEHVVERDQAGYDQGDDQWLRGKVITVVNRSEVVGRPLASFLANSGATVHSVDHFSSHIYRPSNAESGSDHAVDSATLSESGLYEIVTDGPTIAECLRGSEVVISGVPVESFKVPTEALRDGVICLDFSTGDGNFQSDVNRKASIHIPKIGPATILTLQQNA